MELNLFNKIDKYKNYSQNKIHSRISSKELSKDEIDENIRQCYTNLKKLKKTFKGRNLNDNTYFGNKYKINLSTPKKENQNRTLVLSNYHERPSSNDDTEKQLLKNYSNNNIKNASSSSKIIEYSKSKPLMNYIQYRINHSPIKPYNNLNFIKNYRSPISSPLIKNKNISNVEVNNNSSYVLLLQKKLIEQNKSNKNIITIYNEIKIKYEKLLEDNKSLNEKLKTANKQIYELEEYKNNNSNIEFKEKYEQSQKQIDILKNSLLDYQKLNNELTNQSSLTQSKLSDNELKSVLNIRNLEIEIKNLKNQILLLNNSIYDKDKLIKDLKENNNTLKEEIKNLNEQNIDFSNKIFSLYQEIKIKDKTISNLQKNNVNRVSQTISQDNSLFDLIHSENNSTIYKRKTLSDFSTEKKSNHKKNYQYIEEIKLKIPSSLKENVKVNRELPNSRNNIQQLINENLKNKTIIESLNIKLKSFNDIENKYEKILSNQNTLKEENFKKYFTNNITPIESLNNTKIYYSDNKDNLINVLNNKDILYEEIFVFGLNNMNLILFNLKNRKFEILKLNDIISEGNFLDNYQKEGTIIYNILNGVFILTGKNSDILYLYNHKIKKIKKICQFENNHNSGSMILNKERNKIYIISGKFNRKVESYNYKEKIIEELPECNIERSNATFSLFNDKIFGFFGFCYPQLIYNQSIEFIDLYNSNCWKYILINNEKNYLIKNISSICFNNENKIIILGGTKNDNEFISNLIYEYNINENKINIKDIEDNKIKQKIYFDRESHFEMYFNQENKMHYYIGLDHFNNVHIMNENGDFELIINELNE